GPLRFTGFRLRPAALVTFAQTGSGAEEVAGRLEATITAVSIRLRCESPEVGTVTIEGRFLTRVATTLLDTPVVSAVVTVHAPSGEVYSARDSFVWQDRKSTRLNSSHQIISYAVFCLKKKNR